MKTLRWLTAMLVLTLSFAGSAFAQADPTLHQIYEAEQGGHLARAQQMMKEVLRDHPQSAKAHFVAAELYARAGDFQTARQELSTAQALSPGLSFANPESVHALQRELSQEQPTHVLPSATSQSLPWITILAVALGVILVWLMMRGRNATVSAYPQASSGVVTPAGAPVNQGVAPSAGTGIASSIVSGLAVGAGVVAGEDLARRFIDGKPSEGASPPATNGTDDSTNADVGGTDFGVKDANSWDDGGAPNDDGDDDDTDWT
ncbi:MAG: tetratricopeptide repeat protein [Steroidobacteraceae bacterium]